MTYEQWIREVSKTTYLFEVEKNTKGPYNTNPYNKMKDLFYQSPDEEEGQQEI